jgi:hypothetical protein
LTTVNATLCSNKNAGVGDHSRAERSRGIRLLMNSLKSATNSGAIVGAYVSEDDVRFAEQLGAILRPNAPKKENGSEGASSKPLYLN